MNSSQPIFILGSHKSGTTLLRCLLDGHPELVVLPIETHTFAAAGFPINYPLRPSNPYNPRFEADKYELRINELIEFYAETEDRKGDFVPKDYMQSEELKNAEIRFSEQTTDPGDKIRTYWEQLFSAFELDSGNKRIVEKSVDHLEFVTQLKEFFPDATFLHILRNPYRNILSIRKAKYTGGDLPYLKPFVEAVRQSFETATKWKNEVENYHLVRYESIVDDTSAFANGLSEILHIQDHKSLTEPTVLNGRYPWRGNSVFKDSINSVVETEDRWQSKLTKFEVKCVNMKLHKLLRIYGYEKIDSESSILKKAGEKWRSYIKNRFYFYFNL